MKKSLLYAIVVSIVAACLPVSSATAIQRDITVPDASFEDHILVEGGYIDVADAAYTGAWECVSGDAWVDYLYWANNGWPEDLVAHTGNNKVYPYSDYLYQILDETFIEDGTYTLKVWVGQPWAGDPAGWKFYLTTEDYTEELIEASGDAGLEWGQVSLVYTATAAAAGKQVGIKITCDGEVSFDDVTLSYDGPIDNLRATNPIPPDGSRALPSGTSGDGFSMLMKFTAGYGATTHTAWFSSDFNDVNDRNPAVRLGSPPYPEQPGYETAYYAGLDDSAVPEFARTPLERGVTYYWAVDESNDTAAYPGHVWSYTIASDSAWTPNPSDGEELVVGDPSLTLSWLAGDITNPENYSVSYNVYWGTDRDAVEAGTSDMANVSDPTHIVGPLSNETEHYWKVDTVLMLNAPPNTETIIEGPVWQFTTGPEGAGSILREVWNGITGTAISDLTSDPRYPANPDSVELLTSFEGPSSSGVPNDYGSRLHGWLLVGKSGFYKFWIATDDNGELWLSTNDRPANAVLISWVSAWAPPRDFDDPDVTPSDPIYLEGGKKYYIAGLMKEGGGGDNIAVAWEGPDSGDERIIIPGKHLMPYVQWIADSPKPADGGTDVSRTPTLEWRPGVFAAATNGSVVYYSEDHSAVANRTAPSAPVSGSSFPLPLTLDMGQTFYWAVDTVNGVNTWDGDIWGFKVIDWLSVDDMDTYTNWTVTDNNIFEVWVDGMGNCRGSGNGTGANVFESPATGVGESQAMQFSYDNDGTVVNPCLNPPAEQPRDHYYSKAKAEISNLPSGIGPDWTTEGVKALSLMFYGTTGNALEPMWVELTDTSNNSAKVFYGVNPGEEASHLEDTTWHEWNIALSDFTGVVLTSIKSMAIGIGNEGSATQGGSGTLYFDRIRLYIPRCFLSRRSADFAKVDYVQDCVVDHKELEVMAENWLGAVPVITPVTVPDAGFDDQELVPGGYLGIADVAYTGAWKSHVGEGGAWVDNRYYIDDGEGPDLPPLSGNNKVYGGDDEPDYIYQILDETFIEGQTYTLSVWTGLAWSGYTDGWWLYLTTEDYTNNLIEASGVAPVGSWRQVSLAYTATAADAGKKIGIKIKGAIYVTFEDVTLFHSTGLVTADPLVNLHENTTIDFKDFAVLADRFLEEGMFP